MGNKTLHQQNHRILISRCRLAEVDLYNGPKMGGYLFPYSSTSLRIGWFHFQARCCKPGFSFLCVVVYFAVDACLLFVLFELVFSTKPRDWLGRTSQKWPILCWVGRKTSIQSFSHVPRCDLVAAQHIQSLQYHCTKVTAVHAFYQHWLLRCDDDHQE